MKASGAIALLSLLASAFSCHGGNSGSTEVDGVGIAPGGWNSTSWGAGVDRQGDGGAAGHALRGRRLQELFLPTFFSSGSGVTKASRPERKQACLQGSVKGKVKGMKVAKQGFVTKTTGSRRYIHMPTAAVLPNGYVMVAWQASKGSEGGGDQNIYYTSADMRRGRGGAVWGRVQSIPFKNKDKALWSPVLFMPREPQGPGGVVFGEQSSAPPLHLFFVESKTCWYKNQYGINWKVGGDVKLTTTRNGRAWTRPRVILKETDDIHAPKIIANPPVELDGAGKGADWVLPFWRQPVRRGVVACKIPAASKELSGVLISKDAGRSWSPHGKLGQAKIPRLPHPEKGDRLIEGTVVRTGDKDGLLQLFRTTRDFIFTSKSRDRGKSWSDPKKISLPNPSAKTSAIRLSNGELAIVYNAHPFSAKRTRGKLTIAVSADDGNTWRPKVVVEPMGSDGAMAHYPTMVQLSDCRLLVVYSVHRTGIKYKIVDVDFGS
mmetsp:Transcript_34702/g.109594  ORF Transcript_34702/g.109594 Transcript_34702/m.109594 type:complete len:490 (-) Transcript_34702:146-1615(-)